MSAGYAHAGVVEFFHDLSRDQGNLKIKAHDFPDHSKIPDIFGDQGRSDLAGEKCDCDAIVMLRIRRIEFSAASEAHANLADGKQYSDRGNNQSVQWNEFVLKQRQMLDFLFSFGPHPKLMQGLNHMELTFYMGILFRRTSTVKLRSD